MKFRFSVFIATAALCVAACVDYGAAGEAEGESSELTAIRVNPGNPNNPYDALGQLHNDAMDYIFARVDRNSTNETIDQLTDEYFASIDVNVRVSELTHRPEMAAYIEGFASADDDAAFLRAHGYRARAISYYNAIRANMRRPRLEGAISHMRDTEDQILNDRSINDRERLSLLVSAAISRYSMVWVSTHLPGLPLDSICSEDVKGGLSGALGRAITGALTGTVTLPVIGTVAGWLGGGIIGGIGGAVTQSAYAALSNWW